MNLADTEILKFKIIVIQSLTVDDYKTGEHLYEDVIKWKEIIHNDVWTFRAVGKVLNIRKKSSNFAPSK